MDNVLFIFPLFLSTVLLLGLFLYSLWHHDEPVAIPLAIANLLAATWPFTYGLELASATLSEKVMWMQVRFVFLPFLSVAWFLLVVTYLADSPFRRKRFLFFLSIVPSITPLLALTSQQHTLFRFNYEIIRVGQFEVLRYQNGPWFWVYLLYTYAVFITFLLMMVQHAWQGNGSQKKQSVLIIVGISLPLLMDVLFQTNLSPVRGYNFGSAMSGITAILLGVALFRFHLLSVIPVARSVLVENMPEAIVVLNLQERIIDANPAAINMLQLPRDFHQKKIDDVIPNWGALSAGTTANAPFETVLDLNAPEYAHVALRIQSIRSQRGNHSGWLLVFHNITAHHQIEQALRESQAVYQDLVDAMPIGIFRKNLESRYVFVNQIYCTRIHKSPNEIIGKTDWELYPEEIALKHVESDRSVIESGQPFSAIDLDTYHRNTPQHLEFIKIPVRNADGQVIGVQGIFWDVTERIGAEDEFRQRMQNLAIINSITQAITSELDFQTLLELIAQKVMELLQVQSLYIALLDQQNGRIEIPYLLDAGQRFYGQSLKFGEGLTSYILKTRAPLTINESYIETSRELGAITRVSMSIGQFPRSWTGVPIMANGQAIGVIGASDYENENSFQESDIRLLTTVASNIGIAIQKARLYESVQNELEERHRAEKKLEQRLHELTVVSEVSQAASAKLDLKSLIDFAGEKIENLLMAKSIFIALVNKQNQTIELPYWTIDHKRVEMPPMPFGRGLTWKVIESGKPLLIEEDFTERAPQMGAVLHFIEEFGYPKTWLGVPMTLGSEVVGAISIQDYEREHAFSQLEVSLLTTIATNIAISIENARLYNETLRRVDEMALLYKLGISITSNLDMNAVLREILDGYRNILPMDSFFVSIFDETSGMMSYPLFYDRGKFLEIPARNINQDPGMTGYVIGQKKTIYIPDTLDPAAQEKYGFIHVGGTITRASIGVPLIVRDRVIGVISIQSYQPNAYSEENMHLLEMIAPQAATAIENSQLYEKIRQDYIALQEKIRQIDALQAELREQAIRDPLTNLFNRRYLQETLTRELSRVSREKIPLSLIMMDIDHFKVFNDTYGHAAGDALLKSLAELLRARTRNADIACRFGGEEFIVVMPGSSIESATKRAEEIRQHFQNKTIAYNGHALSATLSLGVSVFPLHGQRDDEIINCADQALYAAKSGGRNQVIIYGGKKDP